ncbi:glutamic acid-rich protein-like [Neodiprion fabricii]|uniref:glutamic acid-rich protein-like n=1 Tax=Neodiprion fabricii TaxID=2872261 RepID=UPI001ED8ECD9|nr:glutamic acid-rich protein-like [Neodiprion fabricii]
MEKEEEQDEKSTGDDDDDKEDEDMAKGNFMDANDKTLNAGDDDREFQQNLAGEHHHLESSPSPTNVENEEEGNDDDVDEERVEFADDFDGCEDVHVRFRLLLDEVDQIHQMLGDIARADDDGYYSDEDWCVAPH